MCWENYFVLGYRSGRRGREACRMFPISSSNGPVRVTQVSIEYINELTEERLTG